MNNTARLRWEAIALDLNSTIEREGYIKPDNRRIWQTYMHRWYNDDWQDLLLELYAVYTTNPEYFRLNHVAAMRETAAVLDELGYVHDRLLDMRSYKKYAWRMAMVLREVWNRWHGINLPNPTP